MHPRPEGAQEAHPPVTKLIAEALEHDGPIRGQCARDGTLLFQVAQQVPGRQLIEIVALLECRHRALLPRRPTRRQVAHLACERPQLAAQLDGSADTIALPEGHLARFAGRRRDQHPVVADRFDTPGRRAQEDDLALPRFVDHLFVQLPHAPPACTGGARAGAGPAVGDGTGLVVREEYRKQAAFRDGAARGDSDRAGVAPRPDGACGTIPDDSRTELGELVAGVLPREHAQDRLEGLPTQLRVVFGPPDQCVQLVRHPGSFDAGGDDLLGEDIQRVAGHDGRLDRPLVHQPGDDRALQEVAPVLGEDDTPGWFADLVARTPDALQPPRDRQRRLDLDDQVDGTHVDTQLQGAGGHEGRQPALLQHVLDDQPLLPRERAMVCAHQVLARQLVQFERQAFRQPPTVGEHDRAAMSTDEFQDPGIDRGPDARALDLRRPPARREPRPAG